MTDSERDHNTALAMQQGSWFERQLGELALRADPENLRRIKQTWPELWTKFRAEAERLAKVVPQEVAGF